MNQPPKHEIYLLEDGERQLEVFDDTKIPSAATIRINKQDHTLANMLRAQLLALPTTLFAGYQVPHPLHPYFLIKLQTDGSVSPSESLEAAATKLIGVLGMLETKFAREFQFREVEGVGEAGGAGVGGEGGAGAGGGGVDAYGGQSWTGGRDYLDF